MAKIFPPVLESQRLILRPLTVEDMEAAFKWTGDPRVNKFMIYPLYKSAKDGREWLESLYEDEKKLDYGFVLKSTGELIGSGGLYYHEDIDVWSVGYNIAYDHWHHGYTPEAISRIIEYAKSKYDLHVIAGTFAVDNNGSRRVMEKLGMTFYEDTEYSKLDGSETFKAKTYHKVFNVISSSSTTNQSMKYFRVHTSDIAWLTKQPRGIFTTVGKLVDAKTLTKEEITEYWKQREYFEKVLPVPPFYKDGNPDHAITWFKDTEQGRDIWNQLTFYRQMCSKYGIELYKSETEEIPGEIIYEDDFQIAVINSKETNCHAELVSASIDKDSETSSE